MCTAAPPSRGERAFSLRTAGRRAGTFEALLSPAEPRMALPGSPSLRHPDPSTRVQRSSSSIRLLPIPVPRPSGTLFLPFFPPLFSASCKSLAPEPRTHPAGTGAQAPGAREQKASSSLRPSQRWSADSAEKGEAVYGVSPAHSPTPLRDAEQRRPRSPGTREGRGGRSRGGTGRERPRAACGRLSPPPPGSSPLDRSLGAWPRRRHCRLLAGIGSAHELITFFSEHKCHHPRSSRGLT